MYYSYEVTGRKAGVGREQSRHTTPTWQQVFKGGGEGLMERGYYCCLDSDQRKIAEVEQKCNPTNLEKRVSHKIKN